MNRRFTRRLFLGTVDCAKDCAKPRHRRRTSDGAGSRGLTLSGARLTSGTSRFYTISLPVLGRLRMIGRHTDGNAAAGPAREIDFFDLTLALPVA